MRAMLMGAFALLVLTGCGTGDSTDPVGEAPVGGAAARDTGSSGVDDIGETAECRHPAGFSVRHPAEWSVNAGDVLPVCSWFSPEPFTVAEGTDAVTAAVTFTVRPADEVPSRWPDETARTPVVVDGRAAVRLEQVATPGFYPAGTPITTYVLDLPADGSSLVARTVGLPGADHARDVAVLDAMMASLDLALATDV